MYLIIASLIAFISMGFSKLSATFFILQLQDKIYKYRSWFLLGVTGLNVRLLTRVSSAITSATMLTLSFS